jgi:hypothetical protein
VDPTLACHGRYGSRSRGKPSEDRWGIA